MSQRLTRHEQQQLNRLRLLGAAEKVFAERGIQGAALEEVAAEAGLTKGAVYSNFASKEDLVLAVMRHRLEEAARSQAERLDCSASPPGRLADEFGEFWATTAASQSQQLYAKVALEFMIHALRHPASREQLLPLLFPPLPPGPHPLAPPGSALAELPPHHTDAILKAFEIGISLLSMLEPQHCPPELFPAVLRLLTRQQG